MTFHGKMVSNQGLQSDNKIIIQTISNSRIVTFNEFKQKLINAMKDTDIPGSLVKGRR